MAPPRGGLPGGKQDEEPYRRLRKVKATRTATVVLPWIKARTVKHVATANHGCLMITDSRRATQSSATRVDSRSRSSLEPERDWSLGVKYA